MISKDNARQSYQKQANKTMKTAAINMTDLTTKI